MSEPHARAWTERQDAILREHLSLSDLALSQRVSTAGPSRTPTSVQIRRIMLGLRRNAPSGWTEERVALLKKLDAEGLSASQVAKRLGGVTRVAVIGKLHRLGITDPARAKARMIGHEINHSLRKPKSADPGLLKTASGTAPKPDNFKPRPVAVPADAQPVQLIDLRASQCRWPLDDPGPGNMDRTLFCAAPAEGTYCCAHAAVARGRVHPNAPVTANELARSLRRHV